MKAGKNGEDRAAHGADRRLQNYGSDFEAVGQRGAQTLENEIARWFPPTAPTMAL